jgi:hypothetical protein
VNVGKLLNIFGTCFVNYGLNCKKLFLSRNLVYIAKDKARLHLRVIEISFWMIYPDA